MSKQIELDRPRWLVASGNHERLEVTRSPLVRQQHRIYQPVSKHIEDHGLVLVAREAVPNPDFMYGETEIPVYAAPLGAV